MGLLLLIELIQTEFLLFFSDQLYFVSVCRVLCRSLKGIICCLSK
ncbi:hypothetical protein EH5_02488 [Bacillus subtilis]|nr:hypothetical protein EH5_02488 [Bacillus subtilis]